MKDILKAMIFFRKKKPAPPAEEPVENAAPVSAPPPKPAVPKTVKSLQEIAHSRVLTAEGWRRLMEKKVPKKK